MSVRSSRANPPPGRHVLEKLHLSLKRRSPAKYQLGAVHHLLASDAIPIPVGAVARPRPRPPAATYVHTQEYSNCLLEGATLAWAEPCWWARPSGSKGMSGSSRE